ncbi:hypothetical protein AB0J63_48985, partial [Streptosporangium canum]|uniref:hypothetical protein n=1 Tax=Streptosporangium canum TaxID=324952 RepID=UPI00343F11DF
GPAHVPPAAATYPPQSGQNTTHQNQPNEVLLVQRRMNVAAQSMETIARVDHEGWDDVVLWEAPEVTKLPDDWWHLLDRTEHVLLCGRRVCSTRSRTDRTQKMILTAEPGRLTRLSAADPASTVDLDRTRLG